MFIDINKEKNIVLYQVSFPLALKIFLCYLTEVLSFPPQNILHDLSLISLALRKTPPLAGYLQPSSNFTAIQILSQKTFFLSLYSFFTSFLFPLLLSLFQSGYIHGLGLKNWPMDKTLCLFFKSTELHSLSLFSPKYSETCLMWPMD